MADLEKDRSSFQRRRIERLVAEISPGSVVEFDDENTPPSFIKFRVRSAEGAVLLRESGEYLASEVADKTDSELKALLKGRSGGLLGR